MDWLKKVKKLFGLRSTPSRRILVQRTLSVKSASPKSINPTPQVCPPNEYPLAPGANPPNGYSSSTNPSYPQLHTSYPPPQSYPPASGVLHLPPPQSYPPTSGELSPPPPRSYPPTSGVLPPPPHPYGVHPPPPPPLVYPPHQQNPPPNYGQPSNPVQPTNQGDAPDANVVIETLGVVIETLSAVKAEDVVGLESD